MASEPRIGLKVGVRTAFCRIGLNVGLGGTRLSSGPDGLTPVLQSFEISPSSPSTLHTLGIPSVQLTATGTFIGGLIDDITGSVVWQSANPLVATVVGGLVIGLIPGTTTITATAADGTSHQVTVTVAL